jgi:hypothetical protein
MQTRILRAVALLLLTVMGIRFSYGQTFDSGDRYFNINTSTVGGDSVTTVICKDGPLYVLQLQGDKVLNFSVDGRPIPLDGLGKYQAVIASIKVQVKEAERQAVLDRQQADRDRQQAELDRQQAERDRQQAEQDRRQSERDRLQAEQDRRQADRDREQAEREGVQAREEAERDRQQADRDREQDRMQAERDRQQAGRDREQAERDREQAGRDRVRAEEDRRIMDSVMNDLVADGIVPDRESVHMLKIDANEVIVNGKRLSEAMEKKYLARYGKKGCSISMERD